MTAATATLTDFLLERIAEDEGAARAVHEVTVAHYPRWATGDGGSPERLTPEDPSSPFLPARVLTECEAKRRIVELHRGEDTHECVTILPSGVRAMEHIIYCDTLRHLAAIYASHPDYNDSWRP